MIKVVTYLFIFVFCLIARARAELTIYDSPRAQIIADNIKVVKNGILLGENSGSTLFNGLYIDTEGNLNFQPKILGNLKITDMVEDEGYYYATSFNTYNGQQGLFKISKDFKSYTNIGIKATLRKVAQFRNKVYVGGTVHGCYVVNKDGTGLTQILGDGYYGPYIDDIKTNSNDVFVLSRGNLYKFDYQTNIKTQIYYGVRPSFIEVDDEKIYSISGNRFQIYNLKTGISSNERYFPNQVTYFKKYRNYLFVAETNSSTTTFWFSNDNGITFYKSNTTVPSVYQVRNIEAMGEKDLTLYFNFNYYGTFKGKLVFDFKEQKLFEVPFNYKNSNDLYDKITSYFDHRFPYLGNQIEDTEFSKTTLNFLGKELPEPYLYYSSHDGIDFGLPLNAPIYAVESGEASYFYQESGLGNTIMISHPNGYLTLYGHLSNEDLVTKSKTTVIKNQKIGKVGMSGNTNGPHLHFTTYKGNKILNNKVDPFGWFGSFTDPWSSQSTYLWKIKPEILSYQLNLSRANQINVGTISLVNNLNINAVPINLTINKIPPIFDFKNYLYKENTSYQFGLNNFLNEAQVIENIVRLKFNGFDSYADEKNYSIWKLANNTFEKQESTFDPYSKSLNTLSNLNGDYLVLKNNFQKITTKSNFKTN
jgi:murein DD-endopeptidase MepM/ murein hydrolase activator NlpD